MELDQYFTEKEWGLEFIIQNTLDLNDNNFLEIVSITIKKCHDLGKDKLLIDLTELAKRPSMPNILQSLTLSEETIGIGVKIALIAPHFANENRSFDVEKFGYKHGVFILYFSNRDMAMKWLLR